MTGPVPRPTARVLPVGPDGSVLLLRELDPAHPALPYWSTVGGGVEEGEPLLGAAVRELREETGIRVDPDAMLGPVHEMQHAYTWNHVPRVGHHTYFALPIAGEVEVSLDGLEPEEVDTVLGAAWWAPEDLRGESYREPGLPGIMQKAIDAAEGPR